MQEIVVSDARPTAQDYIALRAKAGWGTIDEETAVRAIGAAASRAACAAMAA
jgi:hypothetical protein